MPLSFVEWTHIDNTKVVNGSEWKCFVLKRERRGLWVHTHYEGYMWTWSQGCSPTKLFSPTLRRNNYQVDSGHLGFYPGQDRMGCRWYIPWYQRGILSCRETLWELGNWIKWKSKILPEYALCLVKFVSILKRCNHGSGCEILQRMWEFGVFYVNNQCLPWEPREGELCWSFIFSLAFTSPLMFIFFLKF